MKPASHPPAAFYPDEAAFREKTRQGNLIPVWRELLLDQDTPVSAYTRLRQALRHQPNGAKAMTFLLESVTGGEQVARYSFLGGPPRALIQSQGRRVEITAAGGERIVREDAAPLEVVRDYLRQFRAVPDPALPRFSGGAVGYVGYDAVAQFDRVPLSAGAATGWPDLWLAVTDTLCIFDHVRHTVKVVAHALVEDDPGRAYRAAQARIEAFCAQLATPTPHTLLDARAPGRVPDAEANMTPAAFQAAVRNAQEYIRAGDIIQTVLSQRFSTPFTGDALDVYRALRVVNPSPYMFCLEFGDRQLIGSSPEIHVRCEDGRVETRPIAGTRPRADDPAEDDRLAAELLADAKERAEHVMLVDLARNDLGRVCRPGTVRVTELMTIERYSHVMHIVSHVTGELAADRDALDLLQATFPAGTVSGAPKIRAMQIIAELEPDRRGPYAGAVGYLGFDGRLDSCITIRTVRLENGRACIQAGAGIVADSDPAREYEETRNKAQGLLQALALARRFAAARAAAGAGDVS